MISIAGIRGIVGEGLTPELLVNYSAAVGTFYGKGRVLVGRDSRVTGEMVKHAVFSGLMSVGCDPIDLGLCTTPTGRDRRPLTTTATISTTAAESDTTNNSASVTSVVCDMAGSTKQVQARHVMPGNVLT